VPPRSVNTERGSRVWRLKRQRTAAWRTLLQRKLSVPDASLRQLARDAQLSKDQAAKRWKAFQQARTAGVSEAQALDDAAADNRGGSNRAFSLQQEQLLGDIVRVAAPALTHTQIQDEALRFKRDVDSAVNGVHGTRSRGAVFRASDHFVSGFKRRQRLSSHRTAVAHQSKTELGRDMELEKLAFVVQVRAAIARCGPARVFNMDETPVSLLDVPITAVVQTGSKEPAKISTPANTGTKITTFPTISAAGDKLPLCAILKGKTPRCLAKIKHGGSADVNKLQLYYSEKGWINEGIMQRYFTDVLRPAIPARSPAALILDSYRAHFTPAVLAAAKKMKLELIQVPGGCTSELQPLDVSFNGPLLMKRKQIWARNKLAQPFSVDSPQAAVERAQQAYASLPKSQAIAAFRKAFLID
jgi:hypothetical protein